jgi:RNA polymerase sigma-B factor
MSIACETQTWDRRFPASERREQLTRNLLAVARRGDIGSRDAAALRNEAVVLNRVLALTIARRYHRRGVDDEDIDQVAMVGLCLAVDRWEPTVATPFVAFAGPTISGEIKRHFRDRAWLVRPPRSIQNRVADVRTATEELMAELGREATRDEIAARLDVDVEVVEDARQAADAFHATPLEHDDGSPALTRPEKPEADLIESLAESIDLRRAVEQLPERDRRLVQLRFVDELTQQEVGRVLGVSQMQVSRLLVRLLASLRLSLDPVDDVAPAQPNPLSAA